MFHDICSYDSPTLFFIVMYTVILLFFFFSVNGLLLLAILAAYRFQSHCCDSQKATFREFPIAYEWGLLHTTNLQQCMSNPSTR